MAGFWERVLLPRPRALTAAVTVVAGQGAGAAASDVATQTTAGYGTTHETWQREAWDFYDRLGMLRNAVSWKADMLSRVRLRAGQKEPGNDEPTILDSGPAVELVDELGPDVQAQILRSLATYLTVPGEGWVVGETQQDGSNRWMARSMDEVRWRPAASARRGETSEWEVVDDRQASGAIKWRPLAADSMVFRVWRPHARYYHIADSPTRAALNTMRELELVNRDIQARYLSRLAVAGVIIFPAEMSFPVRPEFMDATDPFMEEWIDVVSQAIRTPGSAAAVAPIPMRVPGEYVGKIQHLSFRESFAHDDIVQKRDSAVRQLAVDLDCPPEALLGLGEVNHWSAWAIDESAFKTYLAPDVELIVGALTVGYLQPRLKAAGVDDDTLCIWYDPSEITQRPDKSQNAKDVYDRLELTGEALRRETGFDEDDAPDDTELAALALRKLLAQPDKSADVFAKLTGEELYASVPTTSEAASGTAEPPRGQPQDEGPPEMPAETPPTGPTPAEEAARLTRQASLPHAVRFELNSTAVLHPRECAEHLMSCPVTHATWHGFIAAPGQRGVYACSLDLNGNPTIGQQLRDADVAEMTAGIGRPPARRLRT